MLPLPFTLIWFCSVVWNKVEAQQCRLVVPSQNISNGGLGHAGPPIIPGNTSTVPSGTNSSGSGANQLTSFAYGITPIRGVNLSVESSLNYKSVILIDIS